MIRFLLRIVLPALTLLAAPAAFAGGPGPADLSVNEACIPLQSDPHTLKCIYSILNHGNSPSAGPFTLKITMTTPPTDLTFNGMAGGASVTCIPGPSVSGGPFNCTGNYTLTPTQSVSVMLSFTLPHGGPFKNCAVVKQNGSPWEPNPNDNQWCVTMTVPASAGTGQITIVKDAMPNDAQDFKFGTIGQNSNCCTPFMLDDDAGAPGADSTFSNNKTFTLPAGSYTFQESTLPGWSLAAIKCSVNTVGVDMANRSVAIALAANANVSCTFFNNKTQSACSNGYPMSADVNINPPGSPFGPQTVHICRGGHVVFHNLNSGANWTIVAVPGGPTNFPPVPVPNNGTGTTSLFPTPGNQEYIINGSPPFVVHGHIIIH